MRERLSKDESWTSPHSSKSLSHTTHAPQCRRERSTQSLNSQGNIPRRFLHYICLAETIQVIKKFHIVVISMKKISRMSRMAVELRLK